MQNFVPAFTLETTIDSVTGFRVAGVSCGLKGNDTLDFALIVSDTPCTAAGVFTTNQVKAAPVLVDAQILAANPTDIRAVAVNTRCANACTGDIGIANAHTMAKLTADALNISEQSVFVLSTGVIGTQLPMDKIALGVQKSSAALGADWTATAHAIMTTDTRPKLASVRVTTPDGKYTIAGIAKGAGMIAPNMATMLSVIVTDAQIDAPTLQMMLARANETTFNRIVVDGDMSTNDTVLMLANGGSGIAPGDMAQFEIALTSVAKSLAQAVVRDGEGVTKFITLHIEGAPDDAAARAIANTIATSPLVKTAFYGGDANWGRMIAAAGRSGILVDPDAMRLWISEGEDTPADVLLFQSGMPTAYAEVQATAIMNQPSITVRLDCGMGQGSATVWTCDLSHEYVSVNGHYRS